jgi:hypothetical protein
MIVICTPPEVIAAESSDGALQHFDAVRRVFFGADVPPREIPQPPPPARLTPFWIDCMREPANVVVLRFIIESQGYADVQFENGGAVARVVEYLPGVGSKDDLRLENCALASAAHWLTAWYPNPTRVARMVSGYGLR